MQQTRREKTTLFHRFSTEGALAGVRSVPRAPEVAGLDAVGVGGEVAELLEGIAPVAEALRAIREGLQLPRLHFRSVLRLLEVAHLRRDAVDGAVEPLHLAVQHVGEAPHQCLALVGHLCAVDGDAVHDDADGLGQGIHGIVLVPDDSAVELAFRGCCTEEGHAVADRCS